MSCVTPELVPIAWNSWQGIFASTVLILVFGSLIFATISQSYYRRKWQNDPGTRGTLR